MRYRLTWFEDQALWTVDVEAPTESAARQAWVDGALPRPEALVQGVDLIDRMDCDKVTGLDAARLFNVLLVDFDWPPPTLRVGRRAARLATLAVVRPAGAVTRDWLAKRMERSQGARRPDALRGLERDRGSRRSRRRSRAMSTVSSVRQRLRGA